MRPSPVVALLVALAAVLTGVPATATGPPATAEDPDAAAAAVARAENATNYLTLDPESPRRTRVAVVSLDAVGSVAVDDARLEARFLDAAVRHRLETAPNETARRAAIRRSADRLADRIDQLVARERRARAGFNEGRLDARAYLRELAVTNTAADRLQGTVEHLYSVNRAAGSPVPDDRLARLKLRLLTIQGPVRDRIAAAMTGGGSADARVFVRSSETGTILSTINSTGVGTSYVREAQLGRDVTVENTNRTDVSSIDMARERFLTLYPWATGFDQYNIGLLTTAPYYLNAGVYALGVNHPQGTSRRFDLESYVDGDTGQVFHEHQYLNVDAVRMDRLGRAEADGLRLVVEGTYVGGPVKMRAVETATGEPVSATVAIDGRSLGRADAEGELVALAPDEEFTLTASHDGRTVTLDVTLTTELERARPGGASR